MEWGTRGMRDVPEGIIEVQNRILGNRKKKDVRRMDTLHESKTSTPRQLINIRVPVCVHVCEGPAPS